MAARFCEHILTGPSRIRGDAIVLSRVSRCLSCREREAECCDCGDPRCAITSDRGGCPTPTCIFERHRCLFEYFRNNSVCLERDARESTMYRVALSIVISSAAVHAQLFSMQNFLLESRHCLSLDDHRVTCFRSSWSSIAAHGSVNA